VVYHMVDASIARQKRRKRK